jgi:predicted peroxiredoxin
MEEKILIVMTSGPETPRRCATPFFMASLAAAMEYEVTMFFTIDGILLLKEGVAEGIVPKEGGRAVAGFLEDARDAGVELLACTAATELHDIDESELIDGVRMVGGATMWQVAEEASTVLTF